MSASPRITWRTSLEPSSRPASAFSIFSSWVRRETTVSVISPSTALELEMV